VKAFLLAGGRGERLRPLTLSCPKCLVPINGVPLLRVWLELLTRGGVTDVLLNVSHHAEAVRQQLQQWYGPPRVQLVIESEPQGTAGTVVHHRRFVEREESFWVFYADNLTDVLLDDMRATHSRHTGPLTMGLFHAPVPSAAGIVEMNGDGRIVSFTEKPAQPKGDLANAGMYLVRSELLRELPESSDGLLDFGFHILPALVGRMYGHVVEQFVMDIGTPEALAAASAAWEARPQRGRRR
jgi:mannose-1-phosphate guanylyltransferase